ncbi:hypothetical protein L1987_54995 [Smallanthus sonchifolius]|uniref:Uncharacterized protein n=1 Tax=Smallanthus sonchifolius TaxID=185202 RepID=A0ACB9E8B6_9ASTR|nr:hypothetical protein L1987_54995 [Smallanthus sonchifolius]
MPCANDMSPLLLQAQHKNQLKSLQPLPPLQLLQPETLSDRHHTTAGSHCCHDDEILIPNLVGGTKDFVEHVGGPWIH